jgi:hypothetical protein
MPVPDHLLLYSSNHATHTTVTVHAKTITNIFQCSSGIFSYKVNSHISRLIVIAPRRLDKLIRFQFVKQDNGAFYLARVRHQFSGLRHFLFNDFTAIFTTNLINEILSS